MRRGIESMARGGGMSIKIDIRWDMSVLVAVFYDVDCL